jgi:hypothetical protein
MTLPISLIVAHFVGDFLLQSDWMALNKSKNFQALSAHVLIYSLIMMLWAIGHLNTEYVSNGVVLFALATFITHLLTDAVTSRITSKLWFLQMEQRELLDGWFYGKVKPGYRHWFFVMIGFDQVIHYVTLALTIKFLS